MNLLRVWGGGIYESRRLLRDLRRARPDGLAGLPVRLRRLPRGGAAARRGRSPRRATTSTRLMPHPSLVLWNGSNENIWGYARLGLAGAARTAAPGAWATTSTCCPRSSPSSTPAGPYCAGQPVLAGTRTGTPTTPPTARMHIWDVWNAGRLHRLPRLRAAVRGRVRLAGAAGLVDADPRRARRAADAGLARACCCTRRPPTATASSPAAWCRTCRCPTTWTTGTGRRRSTRPGPSPSASSTSGRWARTAPAASSGSSTTAGRSRPGPPSTATDGASRSGTPCAQPTPTGCSRSSPGTAALAVVAVNDTDHRGPAAWPRPAPPSRAASSPRSR